MPPFLWMGKLTTVNLWMTRYLLDEAVCHYGNWVESKLLERDEHTHKRKHTLESLLGKGDLVIARHAQRRPIAHLGVEIEYMDGSPDGESDADSAPESAQT